MPSVGTLNLTVESNAGEVGKSLGALAGALERIQKAIPSGGLGLGSIASEITGFITEINKIKSASTVFKSIEQLGNGLKGIAQTVKYSTDSIKEVSEGANKAVSSINVQPLTSAITKIKAAIGKGFNLGMAGTQLLKVKDALDGEWNLEKAEAISGVLSNIASSAREFGNSKISSIAGEITELTKSINQYAEAAERYKGITDNIKEYFVEAGRKQSEWVNNGGFSGGGKMPLHLQFFGGKAGNKNNMADASGMGDWRFMISSQAHFSAELQEKAEKIKDVVSQMQVTKAVMQNVADSVTSVGDKFSSAISEESVVSPIRMISESFREAEKYIRYYESGIDAVLPKINQLSSEHMIEAGNARLAAMSEKELRIALLDAQGDLPAARTMTPVQTEQIRDLQQFNIELQETGSIIESVIIPRFQEMYQIWSMMAYEFGAFKMETSRLTGGENPLLLGDGKTPGQLLLGDGSEPETFLSTWVRAGEEFKTNWVYFTSDVADQWRAMWSPDWILGGWQTPVSMSTFHLGAGDSPLLLGDGGVSPENMLSTYVDTSEQWKQNWIVGEGYVSDVAEETEQIAAVTRNATESVEEYERKFAAILAEKQQEAALAAQIRASQESSFYAEKPTIGLDQTNRMADNLTQLDLLKAQLQEAEGKYNQFVNELGAGASKTIKAGLEVQRLRDAIWEYNNALNAVTDAQEETETTAFSLSGAWSSLKGAMTRMFPTISGLLKRFKSMTTMRAMRYVIRQLAAGFSEGVQNVYQYSKAVGTSLAPAMDQAATALQQMKNSIGAAVAPVIQALVPVLQTVVNWLITGINYLNQFFALLNGQSTWTRALPEAAEAFEKNTKAAKGTSKAMKDLLADWDELNIIQSQNAGGSGSGTGKTAEEYKNMFEEVNSFDDKVKNTLAFIDEHLGGLSEIIKKAGIALLGWKFSKAFTGLLGTLGKLVAGGAIVAIGLDLSYGAAYDAGAKGYFDTQDILRSIIGGLAAAIGGSLITTALGMGGVLGFGIGLMAAAVVTIVGYCQGEQDLKDKNKWGNLTWTQDQIEQFVREQFTFPVDAEIDVFDAHLKSETEAKNQVDEAVGKFNKSLEDAEHIVADIDTSTPEQKVAAVKQAAQDAQEAIKALQALIDANENGLTYTLTNFTFKNAEGDDITADLLDSIQVSNTTLRNYFNNVGQDLAKLMLEGEKSGWKNGEMDAALELMASQKRIYDRAAELKDKMTFETQASSAVKGVVSRETALSIYEEQKKKLEEYEATVKKTVENEADNLMYLATLAESAAEEVGFDTEQGQKLHQAYLDYLADYNLIMDDLDGAVEDRLKETKQKMADEWSKVLLEVYGDDFVEAAKRLGNNGLYVATLGDSVFGDYEWDSINRRDIADSANRLYTILLQDMTAWNEDYNGLVNYYVGSLGGKLFDLISEDAKKVIAEKLLTHADNAGNAFQIFKAMFGLDEETAKRYIDPGYQDIWADALEEQPPVEFVPNVEVDENALLEQMKTEVEDALQDGQLDLDEQFNLMVKFSELGLGVNALDDVLKELEYNLDEEGYSTCRLNPKQFVASSTGIHGAYTPSGDAYSPYFVYPNQQATTSEDTIMSEEDYANAVESGTTRANRDQNDILNSIMRGVEALLRKEWTVNVSPSSDWGNHNAKSGQAWNKVTG